MQTSDYDEQIEELVIPKLLSPLSLKIQKYEKNMDSN